MGGWGSPTAYSEDSGEQIGGMTYRLVAVGDVRPAYPVEMADAYSEWSAPEGPAGESIPYDDDGFDLLHVLTNAEAQAAGLVPPKSADGPSPRPSPTVKRRGAPRAVRGAVSERSTWIDRDTLYDSYRKGAIIPDRLTFVVSCGEDVRKWTIQPTRRALPPSLADLLRTFAE